MIRTSLPAAALVLAACSTPDAPPVGGLEASQPGAGGRCDADAAQRFVGEPAGEALGQAILDATGARTLRWGGPTTAFTMDAREDRVNVIYSESGVIDRIYCG